MRIRLLFTILAIMSAVNLFGQDLDAQYATTLLPKGTQAPDFTLNNLDGKPFRLSSLRGRRVVLVFWASWCPDCRAEVPELKAMYGKGGAEFVSVSFDRDLDTLKVYANDNALPGIQLFDPAGKKDSEVAAQYGVKWIPSLYLIGPDGKVELGTVVAAKIADAIGAATGPERNHSRALCTDDSCTL